MFLIIAKLRHLHIKVIFQVYDMINIVNNFCGQKWLFCYVGVQRLMISEHQTSVLVMQVCQLKSLTLPQTFE